MEATTLALILAPLALGALLAVFLAPARNAALGAWSLAAWRRRRPRYLDDPCNPPRPPSRRV
jgi:hypothetical protein